MTIFSKHVSPHIRRLYVTGVISDKFINDLNQCLFDPHCNQFTELNFRKTNLSSVQAETLFNALRNNTELSRLDLSSNPIDSSLEELANILPSTNIKELILSETGITDQNLTEEFFAAILKSNVKYLDLSYNHFGEEGAARMLRELFNSTIDKVELKGTREITPQIAAKLGNIVDNECKKYLFEICLFKKAIWKGEFDKHYYSGYTDTSFWIDLDTTTQDTFPIQVSDSLYNNSIITVDSTTYISTPYANLSTIKYNQSSSLDPIYYKPNTSRSIDIDNCNSQNNDLTYLSWIIPSITGIAGCAIGILGKITYDNFKHYSPVSVMET